jgi:hypothetical protein
MQRVQQQVDPVERFQEPHGDDAKLAVRFPAGVFSVADLDEAVDLDAVLEHRDGRSLRRRQPARDLLHLRARHGDE